MIRIEADNNVTLEDIVMKRLFLSPDSDGDWGAVGGFQIGKIDTKQLSVQVGKSMSLTSDVTASVFRMKINADGQVIDLDKLTLKNLAGLEPFGVRMPAGEATMTGFHMDKDKITADGLSVTNIHYDDPISGMSLSIQKANLPKGFKMPESDDASIPRLDIVAATMTLPNLASAGGGGGPKMDFAFLENLNGWINAKVSKSGYGLGHAYLSVKNGIISMREGGAARVANIKREGGNLVFEVARINQAEWKLWQKRDRDLADQGKVRAETLAETPIEPDPDSDGGPLPVVIDVTSNLGIKGGVSIDLPGVGRIKIVNNTKEIHDGDGLVGLTITGKVGDKFKLGLVKGNLELENFKLGGLGKLKKAGLTIHGIDPNKSNLTFLGGGMTPGRLKIHMTSATATNITIGL